MSVTHNNRSIITENLIYHIDASISDSFTLTEVEVLVVAGGGAGGQDFAGGGGGGGVLYSSSYKVTPGSAITVTVGNGGPRPNTSNAASGNAFNGQNSVFGYLTAIGGGAGGGSASGSATNGGSGGGCGYSQNGINAGTGVAGQGYNGELSNSEPAGGGGAGGPGYKGNGGPGLPFSISGTLTYYGGGGGGANSSYFGQGGIGGGGTTTGYQTGDGTPNTGGGGGGYYGAWTGAGAGGSGIVIVRYKGGQKATGGNTITAVNGYTIHTFTTSGTFTPSTSSSILGFDDLSKEKYATSANGLGYNTNFGGGFTFNGSTNYATTRNTTISGDQTFSVWAVVTGGPNSPAGILVQHNYSSTANFGINHVGGNKLAPSIGYTNNTREYADKITGFTITNNIPFNVVLVYNSAENKIYWYINGQLDSSYTLTATPKFTNHPICLGRWDAGYGDYYFNGRIYQASIYKKSLTATEVLQNYNALRSRFGLGL